MCGVLVPLSPRSVQGIAGRTEEWGWHVWRRLILQQGQKSPWSSSSLMFTQEQQLPGARNLGEMSLGETSGEAGSGIHGEKLLEKS